MNKLFSILISLNVFFCTSIAVTKKEEAAQSKEIIEIAQNLILQKDRDQAIRILFKAQLAEKNKSAAIEIRNILKDLGSLFLFDKAQQEYESSINFKKTDVSKSISAVERAQKIEPDNTLIMIEIVRNHLNKKNVDKAKEALEEFRAKNPFDKNVVFASIFLSLANVNVESKDFTQSKTRLKDLQLPNYPIINAYVDFLEKFSSGNKEKAFAALALIKNVDAQNPQIAYWEKRLEGKVKSEDEPICGPFPEHFYRRYYYDLYFCSSALDHYFKFRAGN
ncbi:MAG: hypothetical protein JNL11_12200 [Bdellovibrionaceae bacterium]|nr:hypothetical protein [Pseudobdellovibrionaceae bacterium]